MLWLYPVSLSLVLTDTYFYPKLVHVFVITFKIYETFKCKFRNFIACSRNLRFEHEYDSKKNKQRIWYIKKY